MNLKKLTAVFTASSMLFTITAIPNIKTIETSAASDCIINTDITYQTIKGFGGMNHPEWTGKDLTEAQRQTAFGNGDNEIGMSIVRVYVNDDPNQWYKALDTAKDVVSRGGIVFATPWNPPADMCETFTRTYTQWWDGQVITQENQKRLRHDKYADYAEHLNNFVHYMKDNGVDLYAISIQNEPDYGEDWTWMTSDECVDFLENYADKIDCPVMSPESFSYNKEYYNKILENQKAYENTDIFGTHFYGTSRENMDFPALEQCGKEIFMTEVYTDSQNDADVWPMALDVSENIHDGLVVGNMNAYVWWYIRRSYGPMKEDGTISKRGYCMAQYSKFVRPGYVRVDATEQPETDIKVSAYTDDDKLVVVAINSGTESVVQEFSFANENLSQVERYRTSANENLTYTGNMELTGDGFFASLPAESVTTFVADIDENVQPDENGYYFHDEFESGVDDWSARGTNTVGLSGRTPYKGTNALLVSERTAVWNGAEKILDTSVFKPGETYSFSACVKYIDGDDTENFALTLQYTDENGDTQYSNIDTQTAVKDYYVQLSNTNYTIPANAKDIKLVVETKNQTMNFYVDEVIGAVAGTVAEAPEPVTIPTTQPATQSTSKTLPGDANCDGQISIDDVAIVSAYVGNPSKNSLSEQGIINADVHNSGDGLTANDALTIQQYLAGIVSGLSAANQSSEVDTAKMESLFSGITLSESYKKDIENNPLFTQRFGADPGVMEYNGRVYVYMTNDVIEYDSNGNVTENTYAKVNKINCISSDDMVNWTDHGAIEVAGSNGVAKWADCSWAPCAAHKTINGKEKFFLYFCNGGNGVSVLTADSPTGPWSDPLGHALITRSVTNCSDITWLFDPAVFVDDDGTGYLCFGGGVPEGKTEMPSTSRVVKLGDDMISLAGDPVTINAPYLFEDSGINKIGNKYYYTYCSNWQTSGNSYGMTSGAIEYMVSDNPLGPYTYGGELFKNQGNFFGLYGNNHHSIVELNGQPYLFYHNRSVESAMGITGNYRSPQVDKITMNGEKIQSVTGTMSGISQLKSLNPYSKVQAETMSSQAGINVSGLGDTVVTDIDKGDWIKISGVDFSKGTSTLTVRASSENGAAIKICTGSSSGKAVGYAEVKAGGFSEITVPVDNISGNQDLYFVFSDKMEFDYWYFN